MSLRCLRGVSPVLRFDSEPLLILFDFDFDLILFYLT